MVRPNNNGTTPSILNVAEKPSVARALAGVFSRMPGSVDRGMRREEHQIFTHENVCFTNVFVQGHGTPQHGPIAPHTMITTSVRGHLATTDFSQDYGWSKVDPIVLFDAPIEVTYRPDMEPLERMIRSLARSVNAVILWLDCDREGEAISDEVREVCLRGNPRLQIYRAKFSTVLPQEIQNALISLGRIKETLVQAVQARMELDLRVGAAFTRFQTIRLQKRFDGFANQGVISYGPCQFPTLGFVVERWARIETFVPETFWYIDLSLKISETEMEDGNNGDNPSNNQPTRSVGEDVRPIQFTWKRTRLYDQFLTAYLYESCLDAGEAVVTHLQGRPKNKWRPVPLATVELQKRASRYLRIGSETLMTAAEELYQQGYISYPRTETEKFRPDFNHRTLLEQFTALDTEFGMYANKLLNEDGYQNPRAGQHDDQAHPPITPCKAIDPETINDPNQRSVYVLVVKHYMACCSRDAVGRETQITVRMDSEEFTATGLMVLERNWLEIYHPWERWSTGQGELPSVEIGSRIIPHSLLMKEGSTTAPLPISEVELITLMDRNGIGTDATIAQHITTIQEREYVVKDANMRFLPTKLGIALVEGYNSIGYQLNKPDLRRETEAECNLVAAGHKTKDEIMLPLLTKMKQCYEVTTQEADKIDQAVARHFNRLGSSNDTTQILQARFTECGRCLSMMALKQDRNMRGGTTARRKVLFCETCRHGYNLPRGIPIPKATDPNNSNAGNETVVRCPICNFQVIQMTRGDGYEGNGYALCPKCFSDPPNEHGGSANGGDFRCFECRHPTCTLASGTVGGDVEVFQCPFCNTSTGAPTRNQHPNVSHNRVNSVVCLRKNSRGFVLTCNKFVHGQDRCPYTIWLPKACQTVSVEGDGDENQDTICSNCSIGTRLVKKIKMIWKPGSVPPSLGRETITCILCDVHLRRELEISLPQPNQVAIRPNRPIATPANGRGRSGPRTNGTSTSTGGRSIATSRSSGSSATRGGGRGSRAGGRVTYGGRVRGNNSTTNNGNTCYVCGQPGHFANNCPNR